jgi:hypothetical protein
MSQPQPPDTRQSGPQAKPAPKDALHQLKPGGPIMPSKQGFVNPGPTKNLRGVEPNTAMHRGTPNPEQHGQIGHIGGANHDPGTGEADNAHGHGIVTTTTPHPGHMSKFARKSPTPMPGDVKHHAV